MTIRLNNDFNLRRSVFYYQGILNHCQEQCEASYLAESIRAAQQILQYADQSHFELLTELLGQHLRILIGVADQHIENSKTVFTGLLSSAGILDSIPLSGSLNENSVLESVFALRSLYEDHYISDCSSDLPIHQSLPLNH